MIHFYATILLTIAALILAIFDWRRGFQATSSSSTSSSPQPTYYLLAYSIIVVLAMLVPTPVSIAYKAAILFGLILAWLGTVVERFLKAPPAVLHAIDLTVALLYVMTFLAHHPLKWPTPWLLLPLLPAGILYLFLRPRLAELHSTLLVYGVVLWLLIWQAIELLTVAPGLWTWSAVAGVVGFVLVKSVVAIRYLTQQPAVTNDVSLRKPGGTAPTRWRKAVTSAEALVQRGATTVRLATGAQTVALVAPFLVLLYQWLLVLSIWGPSLTEWIGKLP